MRWQIIRVGSEAILIESDGWDPRSAHRYVDPLRRVDGVLAVIPGGSSFYLITHRPVSDDELARALSQRGSPAPSGKKTVRVAIDPSCGPDLEQFLALKEMTREEFVSVLSRAKLRVRHLGFRPGFAYLEGLPELFDVPRLESPRRRVAPGSFAVAAGMAGFYPAVSPGGWWLLGRSDELFWDPRSDPPNLLSPGDEVTLDLREPEELEYPGTPDQYREGEPAGQVMEVRGEVVETSPLPDHGRIINGEPCGGVWDREMAVSANRAVGNSEDSPILEINGACGLRFDSASLLSLAGEAEVSMGSGEVRSIAQFGAAAGETLSVSQRPGSRSYLAISGGFASFRPIHLHAGEPLLVSGRPTGTPRISRVNRAGGAELGVVTGPSILSDALIEEICARRWRVSPASSRIGVRLVSEGEPLEVTASSESIGAQPGSIQLTPSGELIVLGPEHPVTGGYVQPFTLPGDQLWKLGHLNPGEDLEIKVLRRATCSELSV